MILPSREELSVSIFDTLSQKLKFKAPGKNSNVLAIDKNCIDYIDVIFKEQPHSLYSYFRSSDRSDISKRDYLMSTSSYNKAIHILEPDEKVNSSIQRNAFDVAFVKTTNSFPVYRLLNSLVLYQNTNPENLIGNRLNRNDKIVLSDLMLKSNITDIKSSIEKMNSSVSIHEQKSIRSQLLYDLKQELQTKINNTYINLNNTRLDIDDLILASNSLKKGGRLFFLSSIALMNNRLNQFLLSRFSNIELLYTDDLISKGFVIFTGIREANLSHNQIQLSALSMLSKINTLSDFQEIVNSNISDKDLDYSDSNYFNDKAKWYLKHYLVPLDEVPEHHYEINPSVEKDLLFRVGSLSQKDLTLLTSKSATTTQFNSLINEINREPLRTAPTDLHEGHIVMLLTSGILNGYIGSDDHQHLVKGTSYKGIQEEEPFEDENGKTVTISREYYKISLKTLTANGDIKLIQ